MSAFLLVISKEEEVKACDDSNCEFQLGASQAEIVTGFASPEHVVAADDKGHCGKGKLFDSTTNCRAYCDHIMGR